MKKKLPFILLFILQCICMNVNAQDNISFDISSQGGNTKDKKGFFQWVDKILIGKIKYDTTYIGIPYGRWSISLYENMTRHHYYQITAREPYEIRNKMSFSTGVGISYRGVGIGLSVNFRKLMGETKDSDFYVRLYGNRIGGDLLIFNVGNFYDMKFKSDVSRNNNLKGFRINLYYVFNNKKYSYSSAFSYSQIQKKSAGSVIAVMSFYSDKLSFGYDNEYYKELVGYIHSQLYPHGSDTTVSGSISNILTGWKTQYLSLGAGYAYNFVPHKNWLLHVSVEPALLIWQKKTLNFDKLNYLKEPGSEVQVGYENLEPVKAPYYFFNFACNGKVSASYSWERVYIGAYYITTMSFVNLPGMDERLGGKTFTIYRWWNARMTVGFRF